MTRAGALLLALALAAAGCKKEQEAAQGGTQVAMVSAAELKRGQDACRAYIEQVCACAKTVPAAEQPCALSKALPESIEVALQVSAHPKTERKDAVQSANAIRKTIARCIERAAALPSLGCAAPAR